MPDVGEVSRGDVISTEFLLRNSSPRPMRIERIDSDCGCTTLAPDRTRLEPGEHARVGVDVDTARFGAGHWTRRVRVYPEGAADPIVVSVYGELVVEFEAAPAFLDYGIVARGASASKTLRVTLHGGASVVRARVQGDMISVESMTRDAGESVVNFDVRVAGAAPGWQFGVVILETNSKSMPTLSVPVRFRVAE